MTPVRVKPIARFGTDIDRLGEESGVAARAQLIWQDYAFLLGPRINEAMLSALIGKSIALNVDPHDAILASGAMSPQDYVEIVAGHIGIQALRPGQPPFGENVLIDGTGITPRMLAAMVLDQARRGVTMVLATPDVLDSLETTFARAARVLRAVRGLRRLDPALSAAGPIHLWQQSALLIVIGLILGGAAIAPSATRTLLMLCVSVPFFFVVIFRVIVLENVLFGRKNQGFDRQNQRPDSELPHYAVLVPLFREAAVLPDLVEALSQLNYPAAKLDCMLILEASDSSTIAMARSLVLPPFMRIVVVPDCAPRTKPKALNYALQIARGEFIAVFDAEDVPDPLQLRKAVQAFNAGGARVVCVQARLAIHNATASWLTRQFALEYAALFEGLLPALARFGLPVPLGGTSNHFRRAFLEACGGWDPHNVTEDADLGIRIARLGGRIVTIASVTWEEAPTRLRPWIGQRTRWLKGWMQTYLVHMRKPVTAAQELGTIGFLAFQALLGGVLLSSLLHPLFYLWIGWELWTGDFMAAAASPLEQGFLILSSFNLLAGFASAMAIAGIAALRTGRSSLSPYVLLMPFYWLLVSWAAWRALVQLAVAPHYWEKTEHAARGRWPRASAHRH